MLEEKFGSMFHAANPKEVSGVAQAFDFGKIMLIIEADLLDYRRIRESGASGTNNSVKIASAN